MASKEKITLTHTLAPTYLVGADRLVEALEGIDGFGITQGSPFVSLNVVGIRQHFQLLCDVKVMVGHLLARGLCTDPLIQGFCGWARPTVFLRCGRVVATDQSLQISCTNLGPFRVTSFIVRAGLEVGKEKRR